MFLKLYLAWDLSGKPIKTQIAGLLKEFWFSRYNSYLFVHKKIITNLVVSNNMVLLSYSFCKSGIRHGLARSSAQYLSQATIRVLSGISSEGSTKGRIHFQGHVIVGKIQFLEGYGHLWLSLVSCCMSSSKIVTWFIKTCKLKATEQVY